MRTVYMKISNKWVQDNIYKGAKVHRSQSEDSGNTKGELGTHLLHGTTSWCVLELNLWAHCQSFASVFISQRQPNVILVHLGQYISRRCSFNPHIPREELDVILCPQHKLLFSWVCSYHHYFRHEIFSYSRLSSSLRICWKCEERDECYLGSLHGKRGEWKENE